jgi:hypothetical protein
LGLYYSITSVCFAARNVRQIHLLRDDVPHAAQVRLHRAELVREALGHARCERLEVRDAAFLVGFDELCDRAYALLEHVGVELGGVE